MADQGIVIERAGAPWISALTFDAIRHFAWGIGDNNPLWQDGEYARSSVWGDLIAPPCALYAVDETTVAPGMADLSRTYVEVKWVWNDLLRIDTSIRPIVHLLETVELDGASFDQFGRVDFVDDRGGLLATAETICRRSDQAAFAPVQPEPPYDGEELDLIESLILAESRQGSDPRMFEAVTEGDQLGPLTKGPLSIMDIVAWCAGTQGVAEPAQELSDSGLHTETATGPQQVAWLGQLVTDWAGDAGLLLNLEVQLHENPALGSTSTLSGRVARTFVELGAPLVELDLVAVNRAGVHTAEGSATVSLPSSQLGGARFPVTPGSEKL